MGCCLIAAACGAGAQPAPRLSIALLPPSYAQISWPSNFIGWQLASTTSLTPPVNWQPNSGTVPLGGALVVFAPLSPSILLLQAATGRELWVSGNASGDFTWWQQPVDLVSRRWHDINTYAGTRVGDRQQLFRLSDGHDHV